MLLLNYFLKNIYKNFIATFGIVSFVLVASNIFLRLSNVASWQSIYMLFVTMLPLMLVFSLPIAAGLAVQLTIGNHLIGDELLYLKYSKTAYLSVLKAILIFALSLSIVYIPLVFEWAPNSYLSGKTLLLRLAKDKLFQVEANKFHSPIGQITFFFREKEQSGVGNCAFKDLFLVLSPKESERVIFSAREGFFNNNILSLRDGSIFTLGGQRSHIANFEQSEFDFNKLLHSEGAENQLKHMKFCSWKKLLDLNDDQAFIEWNKRFAQLLWLFLFPFLAFFIIFVFGKSKSNLVLSLTSTGLLFLVSYITTSIAQIFISNSYLALVLLYFPALILFIFFYFWVSKRCL